MGYEIPLIPTKKDSPCDTNFDEFKHYLTKIKSEKLSDAIELIDYYKIYLKRILFEMEFPSHISLRVLALTKLMEFSQEEQEFGILLNRSLFAECFGEEILENKLILTKTWNLFRSCRKLDWDSWIQDKSSCWKFDAIFDSGKFDTFGKIFN